MSFSAIKDILDKHEKLHKNGVVNLDLSYLEPARAELKRLQDSENFLLTLHSCGVDNWEGYSEAVEEDTKHRLGEVK
jgi:hypothetical protein